MSPTFEDACTSHDADAAGYEQVGRAAGPSPDFEVGDVVEVQRLHHSHDGPLLTTSWQRATVVATYTHQVAVILPSGDRMAFLRKNVRKLGGQESK